MDIVLLKLLWIEYHVYEIPHQHGRHTEQNPHNQSLPKAEFSYQSTRIVPQAKDVYTEGSGFHVIVSRY